ncbi:VC0807 family protein [Actinomycetospora termitidis]|uniref:VC0807 family protein n=1 Tax=Actinomycetospora termitidis TaxID=3053470 RepID=A0ABT7MB09_9PSEU|nr:VC0807 family protein [Actinomycetospora sp. Odt1-22]MDL5157855.1 VC0807 family protein [Actinomycetospora sp. Odt1-22]
MTTTEIPAPAPASSTGMRSSLRGLLADVGLPMGTYYGLHLLGVGDSTALLAATVAAGVRVGVVALRTRRLSAFAALMLGVYAIGLAASFVTGDPHLMLLKDSVGTAVVGIGFLVSLALDRPLLLAAMEGMNPAKAVEARRAYEDMPGARRTIRGVTALWGVGLLAEAILRIPVVLALPISVGVAVSQLMTVVVIVGLVVVGGIWVRTARRRAH